MTGYVYAIRCLDRIKIGYSANPEDRFNTISTACPYPAELLGYWSATQNEERCIHRNFDGIRMWNEWFEKTDDLEKFIEESRALGSTAIDCPPKADIRKRKIRDYLHSSGMSPRQFAEEIGVTSEAVRLYLHGERMPRRTTLKRIYEVTEGQVTANDFFEVA